LLDPILKELVMPIIKERDKDNNTNINKPNDLKKKVVGEVKHNSFTATPSAENVKVSKISKASSPTTTPLKGIKQKFMALSMIVLILVLALTFIIPAMKQKVTTEEQTIESLDVPEIKETLTKQGIVNKIFEESTCEGLIDKISQCATLLSYSMCVDKYNHWRTQKNCNDKPKAMVVTPP